MNNELLNKRIQQIKDGGYKRLVAIAENVSLRPNDTIHMMGEERFNLTKQALETVLEDYKEDEIYKYYYELPKVEHGFCTFGRWKLGLLY